MLVFQGFFGIIKIFVYNKNENDETKVWESKLKCKYELLESDDMK